VSKLSQKNFCKIEKLEVDTPPPVLFGYEPLIGNAKIHYDQVAVPEGVLRSRDGVFAGPNADKVSS
jgi:hypothetical protein